MKLRHALAIGTSLMIGLAACSSGQDAAAPAAPSVELAAAEAAYLDGLYQEAQAAGESEVVVYTPFPPALQSVFDAFTDDYPGITVTPVAIAGPPMQARLRAEADSGSPQADLVFMGQSDTVPLRDSDLFEPFAPELAAELPSEYRGPDDLWQMPISHTTVIPYNNRTVDEADLPQTWADLTDPRWSGLLGSGDLAAGTSGTVSALAILYIKGVVDDAWLERAAQLQPTIYPSSGALIQGVATGQSAIALPQGNPSSYTAVLQGAPIGRALLAEGMPSFGLGLAVTRGAPNPTAARLLDAYFFSAKAQAVAATTGLTPTMPGAPVPPGLEDAELLVLSAEETQQQFIPAIEHVASTISG
ncbi:ABC transporter substrate-binding protein [Pseudonocardia lutea]|uniref:ABC transporter substrate-binding protein n=1 Tax=Pseudonocardia lutea TaxID=2172015 RepID=A0ABW1IGL7_9PSEU